MLSDADLSRRLAEAREFQHTIGAVTFRLRVPARAEARLALLKYGGELKSPGDWAAGNAGVLRESLLSICGATTADISLPGEPEPLPETPAGAWAYIAEHPVVLDALQEELTERTKARFESIEGDAKN